MSECLFGVTNGKKATIYSNCVGVRVFVTTKHYKKDECIGVKSVYITDSRFFSLSSNVIESELDTVAGDAGE